MAIIKAIYKKNTSESKVINIREINNENYGEFKGHLYCPIPGCNSKISFCERYPRNYFKTWAKDNHSEDCPYNFEREETIAKQKTIEYVETQLSDKRAAQIMKEHFKQITNPESDRGSTRTKGKRKKTDTNKNSGVKSAVVSMSTGISEEDAREQGMRNPYIRKKVPKGLTEEQLGKYISLIGIIKCMYITDNYAKVTMCYNNADVDFVFEEAFFSNSPNCKDRLKFLETVYKTEEIYLGCIGQIRKSKDDNFEAVIYDENKLSVNGVNLIVYMMQR